MYNTYNKAYVGHPFLYSLTPKCYFDIISFYSDVPCDLCEQLVKHLRDVLIANTTELEFYKVLKGNVYGYTYISSV